MSHIKIDICAELSDRNLLPFSGVPGAYCYFDSTPSHSFVYVVVPILNGEFVAVLPSRDFFDDRFATAIIRFVLQSDLVFSTIQPLCLLEGFKCSGFSFDTVAIESPLSANQFEFENQLLNSKSFVIFPIYRCEFTGDEKSEMLNLLRQQFVSSLDWKRAPCPKITMELYNPSVNLKSSRPGLATLRNVLFEIDNLKRFDSGWIRLLNYAGHSCVIRFDNGIFIVDLPGQQVQKENIQNVNEIVEKFVSN